MARCKLDIDHPKFRRGDSAALLSGLHGLISLLDRDHKLSQWTPHPMPGFPQFQRKIWKWDFRPEGERASTRKGWRLYAYVAEPDGPEPIDATAFLCYDKDEEPKGNRANFIAQLLKKFLSQADTSTADTKDERFRTQLNSAGETIVLCNGCYDVVIISADADAIKEAQARHVCPAP